MHAVALENLRDSLRDGASVLDIGSGSGYLTVAMAVMVGSKGKVVGIEHASALVKQSEDSVKHTHPAMLSSGQIRFEVANGALGLKKNAPYDCIHVGVAVPEVPASLLDQLKPGGRMLIPVGKPKGEQELVLLEKSASEFKRRVVMACVYSPLDSDPPTKNVLALRPAPSAAPRQADDTFLGDRKLTNVELEKRSVDLSSDLQAWQANFKTQHGRRPTAAEMLADPTASSIMTEYRKAKSGLQRRHFAATPPLSDTEFKNRLKDAMTSKDF